MANKLSLCKIYASGNINDYRFWFALVPEFQTALLIIEQDFRLKIFNY